MSLGLLPLLGLSRSLALAAKVLRADAGRCAAKVAVAATVIATEREDEGEASMLNPRMQKRANAVLFVHQHKTSKWRPQRREMMHA